MKDKILKTLLAFLITLNIWGFFYHEHEIKQYKEQISHLQDNVTTKSSQIAKLGNAIKLQNEKQQKVIDVKTNEIKVLEKQVNLAKQKQKLLESRKTNVNFQKSGKGSDGSRKLTVEATAYIAHCSEGCTGRTKTGVNVSDTIYYKGYRVIAVDTSVIPLNSLVKVETKHQSFIAMAIDTGGGINGHEIDVLVRSTSEALNFGRERAKLTILREGKN